MDQWFLSSTQQLTQSETEDYCVSHAQIQRLHVAQIYQNATTTMGLPDQEFSTLTKYIYI